MSGALSHLRVLDLSRILAGPWATQILADMGADVIKVERPGMGDDVRAAGPPFLRDRNGNETSDAAYFLAANRGKRSVTVDMRTEGGQRILHELASQSDIVVENFMVGALAKYRLDYESLRTINPRLVYCSITGFGQNGPYADRPGYDFIFQGMGGLMSITGERDDRPGGGPQKVGVAFADIMTGMYATAAILGAVVHQERTGEGQHIDMALLDVVVAAIANLNSYYLVSGEVPGRQGNAHANLVPYGVFEVADGHVIIAVGNDDQFRAFCSVLGFPEWADDSRFATNPSRIRNRGELLPLIEEALSAWRMGEILERLQQADVSGGPINDIGEVFAHRQVQHRQMVIQMPHPLAGTVPLVASPINLSGTPVSYEIPPPLLGQHTTEVLRDVLGYESRRIEQLISDGVV